MKIYLAGRYSSWPIMQERRRRIVSFGHTVTSRWIDGNHTIDDEALQLGSDVARRLGEEDLEDLKAADSVVFFSEGNGSLGRGGRHTEFGLGIAYEKIMILVGLQENIFHALDCVYHVESFEDYLDQFLA